MISMRQKELSAIILLALLWGLLDLLSLLAATGGHLSMPLDDAYIFFQYARRISERHRDHFLGLELAPERRALFERLSRESEERQRELEAGDDIGFDEFLERYFAQREPAATDRARRG